MAALGYLLALALGVSRTTPALARDRHLPHALASVHPRFKAPHRAELLVGAVVVVLALTTDLRSAIGFSSFGVLVYDAIANAAAWTLTRGESPAEDHSIVGLAGCLALSFALPISSVIPRRGIDCRCRRLRPSPLGHYSARSKRNGPALLGVGALPTTSSKR